MQTKYAWGQVIFLRCKKNSYIDCKQLFNCAIKLFHNINWLNTNIKYMFKYNEIKDNQLFTIGLFTYISAQILQFVNRNSWFMLFMFIMVHKHRNYRYILYRLTNFLHKITSHKTFHINSFHIRHTTHKRWFHIIWLDIKVHFSFLS